MVRTSEVNTIILAAPKWLDQSEHPVTFDCSDHPVYILHSGKHALVMDPLVSGFKLSNILMDRGSGINIIYVSTLEQMGIPLTKLRPSSTTFDGIILGKSARPLGKITLEVIFRTPKNFWQETLTFKVVDFQSAYHAILGRPTQAKFMAWPCYVYLKLKIPNCM